MTQKTETNEQGQRRESKLVRPYLIDLGSTNGCYVNGDRIETQRCAALCARVRACVRMRARTLVRACMCHPTCTCACACLCVCMRARVHAYVCVCPCMLLCMHLSIWGTCACRYVELLEKDCLRFGYSSREYVLLNADKDNQ